MSSISFAAGRMTDAKGVLKASCSSKVALEPGSEGGHRRGKALKPHYRAGWLFRHAHRSHQGGVSSQITQIEDSESVDF